MAHAISPLRHAMEGLLNLLGVGPRHSTFLPARNPESRVRFAQYLRRTQPSLEADDVRRAARFLGGGGAFSHGVVKHATFQHDAVPTAIPRFSFASDPVGIISRRRAHRAAHHAGIRTFLHAFRVR